MVLQLEGNELRLSTQRHRLAEAKALIRSHVPAGTSLAKELIQERRKAAKGE
jgi:hypothetical protein